MTHRHAHHWPNRLLLLVFLLATLSACADEPENEEVTPTRRPRATATARPTSAPRPTTPPADTPASNTGDEADWTVLVYLDGDNDLEAEALDDFGEMATVGSSDQVHVLVQLDRIRSDEDWDDTSNNNWGGVKRFRVTKGATPTKAYQSEDIGEQNMADPETLVDFATWGIENYPARRYALIFWDHGAAWPGIASDDTSDGDMLTLPEIAEAFETIGEDTGVTSFDLIGFDACLMGQIDVLQAVAPYGKVAIGSADLEPGEGWAWNHWLAELQKDPDQDAAVIAPAIIKSFMAFYKQEDETSVTLAAFDLTEVAAMTTSLDELSLAMLDDMQNAYKVVGAARSYAAEYAAGDKDVSAIDLGGFARSLIAEGAEGRIADAAKKLDNAIKSARIYHGRGSDHPTSTGISLYFPKTAKLYDKSYVESSPMTQDTHWDEFLQAFYKAGKGRQRSDVANLTLSADIASLDQPITLEATISGDDTAYVYYFIGQVDENDPDALRVLMLDYLYPTDSQAGDSAPIWPAEETDVSFSWDSQAWYMSNGKETALIPLEPSDYGSDIYVATGTYRSAKTGSEIPVSIEFEISNGQGRLIHIWSFDKGQGNNPRPRELKPRKGDSFIPSFYTLTATDEGETDGDALVFGSSPLVAFQAPAPGADYVVGLMVEDHAGEISDQYADVTVDNPQTLPEPPAN